MIKTINVGSYPLGVTITPDGRYIYVANRNSDMVSEISGSDNAVIKNISVESNPWGLAVAPDGAYVYVVNEGNATTHAPSTVSIIAT